MASRPSGQGRTGEIAQKILRLLESLRQSAPGALLHAEISRYLERLEDGHAQTARTHVRAIVQFCTLLSDHLPEGADERVLLDLLRERLTPPLVEDDLADLEGLLQRVFARLSPAHGPRQVPEPPMPAVQPRAAPAETPSPKPLAPHSAILPEVAEAGPDSGELDAEGRARLDSVYRSHLVNTRDDLMKLHAALSEQVKETIEQNEEFGVMLETVLATLNRGDSFDDPARLRESLVDEVVKMLDGYNKLADKLDGTHRHLNVIESGNRKLNDELERVRQLSLTDDLTALPNRRAFLRRLDEEISRVQRKVAPFAIVIMDLDLFKQINDTYGHAAGDEVLRIYARNILSIFRQHDMVARYGGEEFAALLTNTTEAGVMRALEKVRKRAAETRWQCNGTVRHVPTFSAGVAIYKAGEDAKAIIERADRALYRAKNMGRNHVEMDRTYQPSAEDDEQGSVVRRQHDE